VYTQSARKFQLGKEYVDIRQLSDPAQSCVVRSCHEMVMRIYDISVYKTRGLPLKHPMSFFGSRRGSLLPPAAMRFLSIQDPGNVPAWSSKVELCPECGDAPHGDWCLLISFNQTIIGFFRAVFVSHSRIIEGLQQGLRIDKVGRGSKNFGYGYVPLGSFSSSIMALSELWT
jgi:hypothetical protein